MSKGKATFVTITIAVMLFVIAVGFYLLWKPGFAIIVGVFAAYGYFNGFCDFMSWLGKGPKQNEDPVPPDVFHAEPIDSWCEEIPGGKDGLEAIIDEVKAADE